MLLLSKLLFVAMCVVKQLIRLEVHSLSKQQVSNYISIVLKRTLSEELRQYIVWVCRRLG